MSKGAAIARAILAGRRLERGEALWLFRSCPLAELGSLAQEARFRRHPERDVTYVLDTNPNYTNVCWARCAFCAFSRDQGGEGAYTLSAEEVAEKAQRAFSAGATTLLLQGGMNPALKLDYYLGLVESLKKAVPGMHLHLFSAPEVLHMARISGNSVPEILRKLRDAGIRTLPGGGAEILSDRVRRKLAGKSGKSKATVHEWLDIHEQAHRMGFKSTATMMYGHLEEPEEVIEHLSLIRSLQDATGGFTAFVPWSFKAPNTPLAKAGIPPAGAVPYLRHIAVARLFLDNFDHIQASWFSEGKRTGQIALWFGADDFGGTLLEENVHRESGFANRAAPEEVASLISEAGFRPVRRTTLYERAR